MSLKQVIDEIVKKIRKTEPERQSEDLENAKEQSGKTEPDRSSTSPAVVQVKKPDRQVARYEKGWVYAWSDGSNSWSAENKTTRTMNWKYAKLAEDGE